MTYHTALLAFNSNSCSKRSSVSLFLPVIKHWVIRCIHVTSLSLYLTCIKVKTGFECPGNCNLVCGS